MQLQHDFTLPVPPQQAWAVLLDIERVAPCMPGATLDRVDGDDVSGRVTLKVGPLRLTYHGDARIEQRDEAAHRLVLAAQGREARGSGTAAATVTAALSPAPDGTRVALRTDLALTGRPAQFGRGLVEEVAGKLIGQFADRLSYAITSDGPDQQRLPDAAAVAAGDGRPRGLSDGPSVSAAAAPSGTSSTHASNGLMEENSLDVLSLLRTTVGARGLLVAGAVAGLVIAFLFGRRRRPSPFHVVDDRTYGRPPTYVIDAGRRETGV
ncbi:SRPBCC family protein [Phytoactinopolyspora limicola]|uniref:SRPBCC family protein n=1 Tax=Phytoactinopolyspora limicola TaxID=2715536 RepID=UPI00140931FE|nr:SRPBCC family protein [Phytoactinopolyspora limicola]